MIYHNTPSLKSYLWFDVTINTIYIYMYRYDIMTSICNDCTSGAPSLHHPQTLDLAAPHHRCLAVSKKKSAGHPTWEVPGNTCYHQSQPDCHVYIEDLNFSRIDCHPGSNLETFAGIHWNIMRIPWQTSHYLAMTNSSSSQRFGDLRRCARGIFLESCGSGTSRLPAAPVRSDARTTTKICLGAGWAADTAGSVWILWKCHWNILKWHKIR